MAGHKPMEKKREKMMYGRTPMRKGMTPKRKKKQKTGGLYKGRYGMSDGGPAVMASMENQEPV